jgi:16S rRNA (guanine527-N7)-methyltransferase
MMTSREFRERLKRRAKRVVADVPKGAVEALEAYYRLLAKWNVRINLTALPLDEPTDQAFDRLLIEPLAAARHVPGAERRPVAWFDLGSGGGSPAIPLKIVRPDLTLTMVESKARKTAFLREAIRSLQLQNASVQQIRFEELVGPKFEGTARLVTARAVRADSELFSAAARLLERGGHLLLFHSGDVAATQRGFAHLDTAQISASQPIPASLSRFTRLEDEIPNP